jgi:hypothetical protein
MNTNALLMLALTGGAIYLAWKHGGAFSKAAAAGVAGYMIANNTPIIQGTLQARVLAPAAAA